MKLTGEVILDDATLDELKAEIKANIVKRIQEEGMYAREAEAFLLSCSYSTYRDLIKRTINEAIENGLRSVRMFPSDEVALQQLKIIKDILNLD